MATGYEDIDSLMNQQNNLLNEQQKKQNELINQQTQIQTDELNREKEKIDKDVDKTNQSLYSNWQKQTNQYGVQAEQLAQQGLANSGYAETTKTALYNTYQKNVTDTLNNARDLKSDYDFKIAQARQQGSVQQAQAAVDLYAQRLQLLTQNYELDKIENNICIKKNVTKYLIINGKKHLMNKSDKMRLKINGSKRIMIINNKGIVFQIVNGKKLLIIKNKEMQCQIVNGKNNMNYQKKQPLVVNLPVLLVKVQGRRVAQAMV